MEQTINDIFELTIKKMGELGAYERQDFQELLEESMEYFRQNGRVVDEDNTKFIMEELLNMWPRAKERLTK